MEIRLISGLYFHLIITVYAGAATTGPISSTQTRITTEPLSTTKLLSTISTTSTDTTATPSTTGRFSNGSLTRKPTYTAAIAGSSNLTLECASSYGTDAISWSFTPLDSFNNETIQISNGNQLLTTNSQQYLLISTNSTSLLVVRQVSNLTEGTYSCYDGVESATALLLVIPYPISVEPLFGPMTGGTNITLIASSAIDYIMKHFGSYLPVIKDVRDVYIGDFLSSTSVSLLPNGSSTFEVVAVTPSTTVESIGQPLPIIIGFSPTPFNMTFNTAFTYLPNQEIAGISPNSFIVTGGTMLDVTVRSLSSVAKPIIPLTVFITRADENRSTPSSPSTSKTREYENINGDPPDTKFIFYSPPEIDSSDQLLEFDPSKDELIIIKGSNMLRCRLRDYVVHIGNQICTNNELHDNQLSCRPPKEKPSSTVNDTIHCDQHLSITVTLGFYHYQYACLMYTDHSRRLAQIVGLTVGLTGFVLFLTILIVCIVRCRRKKVSQETDRHENPAGGRELQNLQLSNAVQPHSNNDYLHMGHCYD